MGAVARWLQALLEHAMMHPQAMIEHFTGHPIIMYTTQEARTSQANAYDTDLSTFKLHCFMFLEQDVGTSS